MYYSEQWVFPKPWKTGPDQKHTMVGESLPTVVLLLSVWSVLGTFCPTLLSGPLKLSWEMIFQVQVVARKTRFSSIRQRKAQGLTQEVHHMFHPGGNQRPENKYAYWRQKMLSARCDFVCLEYFTEHLEPLWTSEVSCIATMSQWALHSVQCVTFSLFNGGNSPHAKKKKIPFEQEKNARLMLGLLLSLSASLVPLCLFLSERNDWAPWKYLPFLLLCQYQKSNENASITERLAVSFYLVLGGGWVGGGW